MIVWTANAQNDLVEIASWIARDDQGTATRVSNVIAASVERLDLFPLSGRAGRVANTRELIVPRLPYVIVHHVSETRITILRVLHDAQAWPPISTPK